MKRRVIRKNLLSKTSSRRVKRGSVGMPRFGQSCTFYNNVVRRKGNARVCVVRKVGGIGDVMMVTPALRQLKRNYPNLHLTYALDMHTTGNNVYYELVKNCSFIDQLIDARFVKHGEYDAVIDVSAVCIRYERSELPAINRVDLFAKAIGLRIVGDKRSWYQVDAQESNWARAKTSSYRKNGKKIVMLHTASMEGKRCWPINKYIEIVEKAEEEQLAVQFFILDFNNKFMDWGKYSNCTDFSRTTIRDMAALIQEADLFIGPDSGPMHIAGAVGTHSLVLFGSIPPSARINYYPTHKAVFLKDLSCLGCWYKSCPYDIKCMRDIDAMTVYGKMKIQL